MESGGREADGADNRAGRRPCQIRRRLLPTRYEWGLVLVQPAIVSVVTTSVGTKKLPRKLRRRHP